MREIREWEGCIMIFSKLSISSRFLLVLILVFAFQAVLSFMSLVNLRNSLLQDRTSEVKHLLETAYTTVSFYHDQASMGLMTDAAAREAARNAVRAMHYDNGNYYFIWTLDGTGIAHGSHPEWEGKTFINSSTAAQYPVVSYMVSRLIEVSKSEKKEGIATYQIPKPGQAIPLDKIAYTRLFEPWGWSIGTGTYVDDIDTTYREQAASIIWVFAVLIFVACMVTFLLGRDLARALNSLTSRVASVAQGELEGEVPEISRHDEIGVMARALLVLRDTSKEVAELRLDQLTGLYSRKVLMDRLQQAMAFSSRSGNFGGLMLIDLDKFKTLNDTQGHDAGDKLLREVAQRLKACVRECDIVARLGGDEFVVVVVDIGLKEEDAVAAVEIISEKILATLGQSYLLGNLKYICTASIGLTLFKGDAVSVTDLLKQADLALYKSKDSGRNASRFFDPRMEAVIHERMMLEKDLQQAISENQFQLYYQPQVGRDGRLFGAEALIRWVHPEHGLIPPDNFIPLAEETGLILPIGQWVLETACAQLLAWANQPETEHLTIAVNVSAKQFRHSHYVDHVLAVLDHTGADPRKLKLELTESMLLNNMEEVIVKMTALKARGLSFSLDDFGTGYSSLSYLSRLPLDQIKIDRSFVMNIETNDNSVAICAAIIGMAHNLKIIVVAEGIETETQSYILNSGHRCDYFQGYFFGKPMPIEQFEVLLKQF